MNKREFVETSGIEITTLEVWLEQEWIVPARTARGPDFGEIDLARARLIRELRDGIGANEAGIDVILHLMDQLHGLRSALDQLRRNG